MQRALALLLLGGAFAFEPPSPDWQLLMGAPVSAAESAVLREEVREMARPHRPPSSSPRSRPPAAQFTFTYDNYMRHAFPQDELRPISCSGHVRSVTLGVPGPAAHTPAGRTRWAATRSLWWTRWTAWR